MKTLEDIKANDFENFWNGVLEQSGNLRIEEPKLPRVRKVPARCTDSDDEFTDAVPTTEKDYYKKIFMDSFDLLLACLI